MDALKRIEIVQDGLKNNIGSLITRGPTTAESRTPRLRRIKTSFRLESVLP